MKPNGASQQEPSKYAHFSISPKPRSGELCRNEPPPEATIHFGTFAMAEAHPHLPPSPQDLDAGQHAVRAPSRTEWIPPPCLHSRGHIHIHRVHPVLGSAH
jgi:hypothetical protein